MQPQVTINAPPASYSKLLSKQSWMPFCALVLLTLTVYLPSLKNGFIWDDDLYVTKLAVIRDPQGLKKIWFEPGATHQYYPLTYSTFWLQYRLWGFNPFGFHLSNVLLHGLNAALVWLVMKRLGLRGAWFIAALFAVHPVHVETAAWITEHKNTLSAFFYLSSSLLLSRVLRLDVSSADNANFPRRHFYGALLLFLCALLSKTVTCTLPAAALLLVWWKRGRLERRDILPTIPFFLLGGLFGAITPIVEKLVVGASGEEWNLNFAERVLVAGRALWFYAGKLAWPSNLSFIYPRWEINERLWHLYIFPVSALAAIWALWALRQRIGRGPLTGVLYYAGTLFPALGFFNVYPFRYSFVADHFQYLASLGVLSLSGSFIWAAAYSAALARSVPKVAWGLVLLLLSALTLRQSRVYRNMGTLWTDVINKNPTCWLAYNNLGMVKREEGQLNEGLALCKKSLSYNPSNAEALNNVGIILADFGQLDEAVVYLQKALRIEPMSRFHHNLANVLREKGKILSALKHYERALSESPHVSVYHQNFGIALNLAGQREQAIQQLIEAIQLEPSNIRAYLKLSEILRIGGRTAEAVSWGEKALTREPSNLEARSVLATALAAQGLWKKAISHYEFVLQEKPDFPYALNNLGVIFMRTGQPAKAIPLFQRTLKIDPENKQAQKNLAAALSSKYSAP